MKMQEKTFTHGCFITLEGIEGAGKSSLVEALCQLCKERGLSAVSVREPGGTAIAEQIRSILKTKQEEKLTSEAELLLMYAARAQLVNTVIRPALAQGKVVICDRHDLSTRAYQGGGRGFSLETIAKVRSVALGDFKPDLTLLIDVPPELGLKRAALREALTGVEVNDRFESEKLSFFERVRSEYLKAYHEDSKVYARSMLLIDGTMSMSEVRELALNAVRELLDRRLSFLEGGRA